MKTFLALAFIAATVGCANRAAQAPLPGSANQFDSDTYLVLSTAKGVIDQAKTDVANGVFSASILPNVKKAVNAAVTAYNTADVTYLAYHTAALSGQSTAAQQSAVTTSVSNLNAAVNSISTAKAGQ